MLTAESAIIASHRDCTRVQDAYSLRCMPQVHGSAREAVTFARSVIERELASVSDNPLVFPADGVVLSGGNFHGEVLGLALDTLTLGLVQLAGISERRIDRLVNPLTNEGLPPFLSPHGGVHSGYMIAQYVAAALVAELRTLAMPASAESVPTSGLQEDYNSMAAGSALKARRAAGLRGRCSPSRSCWRRRRWISGPRWRRAAGARRRGPRCGAGSRGSRRIAISRATSMPRWSSARADTVVAAVETVIGPLE